jgi:hypothetical protein
LKLLTVENSALIKRPSDAVKEEVGIVTGITFASGKKNTCRYGVYGSYVMENDFGRKSPEEVIKGNPGINTTSSRGE